MSSPYGPVAEPRTRTVENLRCTCGKLLAELITAPYRLTCRHCRTVNHQD
jgi:phage FluMu protein Com